MKKVMNGNQAAAYISYAFTEVASLFPITPATPMAEVVEAWSANGRRNAFGEIPQMMTMGSENGSAGLIHGAAKAGALAATYTCSQGLLLMIPTLYKLAGERLPVVIHVAARSIATSALSIYGDHSDVMAARQTGVMMLASGNVQETALFATLAHVAAIRSRLPMIHFFDGFDTSHEIRDIQLPSYQKLAHLLPSASLSSVRQQALSNLRPVMSGTSQMPDLYFQQRESAEAAYQGLPEKMEAWLQEISPLFPGNHSLVEYIGVPDAQRVMIIMGSAQETVKEVAQQLNKSGEKVGVLVIHLYRPFPTELFLRRLPITAKEICVMDRTKEPGSTGEPLLLDVQQACRQRKVNITGCRYGIGGKEVTPEQVAAVYTHLKQAQRPATVTVGITEDLCQSSLPIPAFPEEVFSGQELICLGTGNDGSVAGFKGLAQVITQLTDQRVQCRFEYSPLKSGDLTKSYLRFSPQPITKGYRVMTADLMLVNDIAYFQRLDIPDHLKKGAKLILNFKGDLQTLARRLPRGTLRRLLEKQIQVYCLPATQLARKHRLGPKINCLMIAAILRCLPELPVQRSLHTYQKVLKKAAFMADPSYYQATCQGMAEIPELFAQLQLAELPEREQQPELTEETAFQRKISTPCLKGRSEQITTGTLQELDLTAGNYPLPQEKTAVNQQQCETCPLQQEGCDGVACEAHRLGPSLLDGSSACRGCGETPYFKLLTQLFGPRLAIANATGCSSIWGGSVPQLAYRQNADGCGPVWANPLFETNSSFGMGLQLGHRFQREHLLESLTAVIEEAGTPESIKAAGQRLLATNGKEVQAVAEFMAAAADHGDPRICKLREQSYGLIDRSQWLVGGDGWAYDIDFGGLDHLLASGQNLNILILDNGAYANTGGQTSKGADQGAKLKLASNGNFRQKKDFAAYAMSYEDVYVAQVSVMADPQQTQQVLLEADQHEGVSVVIAYSHCVIHQAKASGAKLSQLAVASGYWPLFRYRPQEKRPFSADCGGTYNEEKLQEFIDLQGRYAFLHTDQQQRETFLAHIKRKVRRLRIFQQLVNSDGGWNE